MARRRKPVPPSPARPARTCPLSREQWHEIATAWLERPDLAALAERFELPKALADRLFKHGLPEIGAPPLSEVKPDPIQVAEIVAQKRGALAESGTPSELAQRDAAMRAADEGLAAHAVLSAARDAAQAVQAFAKEVLQRMRTQGLEFELTPRTLAQLARMTQTIGGSLETAIRIERLRTGRPEQIIGVQIGVAIDQCTPEELDYVIASGGNLPPRLLGLAARAPHAIEAEATAKAPEAAAVAPDVGEPLVSDAPALDLAMEPVFVDEEDVEPAQPDAAQSAA